MVSDEDALIGPRLPGGFYVLAEAMDAIGQAFHAVSQWVRDAWAGVKAALREVWPWLRAMWKRRYDPAPMVIDGHELHRRYVARRRRR